MKEFAHPGGDYEYEVDVNKIIENAVVVSRNEWKYIADLNLDLTPDLPYIRANQSELGQVVLNMIINAAHAVRDTGQDNSSGRIDIKSRAEGDWICIDISDNGSGIPQKVLDKIFQPFFTTKPSGQGTGLGLSLAYDIIKTHNGDIKVESKEKEGTTFTIHLPETG